MEKAWIGKYWYAEGLVFAGTLTLIAELVRFIQIPVFSQVDWWTFGSGSVMLLGTLIFFRIKHLTSRWLKLVLVTTGFAMVLVGAVLLIMYRDLWWQGILLSLAGLAVIYLTGRVFSEV